MRLLPGKVVVITGSSAGIGRSIALECARHGALVVLHHIGDKQSAADIFTLKAEIDDMYGGNTEIVRAIDIGADVTDVATGERIVEAAVAEFGHIDGIVHNAGIAQFEDFANVTPAQAQRHMSVNYLGPYAITQAVVKQMIQQGTHGSVVSIASLCGTRGASRLGHYGATKSALLGMTYSCAVELGQHGIRFNAVSPGTIETAMNKEDLAGLKRAAMEARVPLRRLGVPADIANPVVFFLSDMASYVSGQNLVVDGGSAVYYQ